MFRQWKRPAVQVPFLPVCLEVHNAGRCAVIAAELSPSRQPILRCMMTALCRCGGSSGYEVAGHLIRPMGCERFILLVIAVVVIIIEEQVSEGKDVGFIQCCIPTY